MGFAANALLRRHRSDSMALVGAPSDRVGLQRSRATWWMPQLETLAPAGLSSKRVWMIVLRGYLIAAVTLVLVKVVQLAVGQ
jgi:hypothetical protein